MDDVSPAATVPAGAGRAETERATAEPAGAERSGTQTDGEGVGSHRPVALGMALLVALAAAGWLSFFTQTLLEERSHLRVDLVAQERKNLDLREQLTRAEVAIQEKDAALATRDVALADATQPELPVRVSFRPAWMGQGMVASFRNVGTEQLTLMVEFRDSNLKTSRDFALVVAAGATAEIGHPQGWLVSSGQSVRVSVSGFRSVTAFAP